MSDGRSTGDTNTDFLDPGADPDAAATAAATAIAAATGTSTHDVAVILGSGWARATAAFDEPTATLSMSLIPGFTVPSAAGHAGEVHSVEIGHRRTLVLVGRTHAYEGHHPSRVVHAVRTVAAAGCTTLVLTNAAGGLRADMQVGAPVLISDHLNLTARSPLTGAQFVDLTDAYSPRLRELARRIDPGLAEGVYAGLPGPHFETPAEIRMLRTIGADLVGMSTVHETIAARAKGLEVLGISLVTNLAAGMTGEPLNHTEVLDVGKSSASSIGQLLATVIAQM